MLPAILRQLPIPAILLEPDNPIPLADPYLRLPGLRRPVPQRHDRGVRHLLIPESAQRPMVPPHAQPAPHPDQPVGNAGNICGGVQYE